MPKYREPEASQELRDVIRRYIAGSGLSEAEVSRRLKFNSPSQLSRRLNEGKPPFSRQEIELLSKILNLSENDYIHLLRLRGDVVVVQPNHKIEVLEVDQLHETLLPMLSRAIRSEMEALPEIITGVIKGIISPSNLEEVVSASSATISQSNIATTPSDDFTIGDAIQINDTRILLPPISGRQVKDAIKLLQSMPVNKIPDPSPLPSGSRMPLGKNPLFVGRNNELKSLASLFKQQNVVAIEQIAAMTGIGGIGKTNLATEFVHRYGKYFAGGVFWLRFAEADAIPSEIAECGSSAHLGLFAKGKQISLDDQVALVTRFWRNELPKLLVFDNCEEEKLVEMWKPKTGRCFILITSRRTEWEPSLGIQSISLDVLERTESVNLLKKFRSSINDDEASVIAEELGDLPLALHLAGSYLRLFEDEVTPREYLHEIRSNNILEHPSLVGEDVLFSPTNHVLHIGRTFALSYDKLSLANTVDTMAMKILARACCFAAGEALPKTLLVSSLRLTEGQLSRTASRAIRRLTSLGLIEKAGQLGLKLHRLVAYFAKTTIKDESALLDVEVTLTEFVGKLNGQGKISEILPLQTHLYTIGRGVAERNDSRFANFCSVFGYALFSFGHYEEAQVYLQKALKIRQQEFGVEHTKTASGLYLLALCSQMQAKFQQARDYYEQALYIREKLLGPSDENTLRCRSDLGYLLFLMGKHRDAEPYIRGALNERRKIKFLQPGVGRNLSDLGYLMLFRGYYRRSIRYSKLALKVRKETLHSTHIGIAQTLNNLGEALFSQNLFAEAEKAHIDSLSIREEIFGDKHTDIAESLFNLGRIAQMKGSIDEAKLYLDRALKMNKSTLPDPHRETARILVGLSSWYRDAGQLETANMLLEEALTAQRSTMDEVNFEVAQSLQEMAILRFMQKNLTEVQRYARLSLDMYSALGEIFHPETIPNLILLCRVNILNGNIAGAIKEINKARDIISRTVKRKHLYSVNYNLALAEIEVQKGEKQEAMHYCRVAKDIAISILSSDHERVREIDEYISSIARL